jgi:predicted ester cyclase
MSISTPAALPASMPVPTTAGSSANECVYAVQALHEAFNDRDYGRLRDLVDGDCRVENVAAGRTYRGADGFVSYVKNWVAGFPDIRFQARSIQAGADHAVAELIGRGTNRGAMEGPGGARLAATERRVELPFCEVFDFRGGRLVGYRLWFDGATFMRQLGRL